MKPVGMSWGTFIQKNYQLWPLFFAVGVGMTAMTYTIIRSFLKKDYMMVRGRYPWDKLDLLRNPYSRKMVQIHEKYDVLFEMDCLYKDMDKAERDLERKRKSGEGC